MKKVSLMIALMLSCMMVYAQKPSKAQLKALKSLTTFLSLPAEKNASHAAALGIFNLTHPSTWKGVTVVDF